jgi:hypothetical protein
MFFEHATNIGKHETLATQYYNKSKLSHHKVKNKFHIK